MERLEQHLKILLCGMSQNDLVGLALENFDGIDNGVIWRTMRQSTLLETLMVYLS